MTDDFQLFPDHTGDPVDADIALITAYLAQELSPVQIVAVEDRLAKDEEFRNRVRPIIDAWVMPSRLGSPALAGGGPLDRNEVEAGWQRYVGAHAELDAHEGPRLVVEAGQPKRRKISMTRIAAGIAAITLPIVTLAQVAVYIAKRPDAPGHTVARAIVEPFNNPTPPAAEPPNAPVTPTPSPVDVPVGRQLEKPAPEVQRSSQAKVPIGEREVVASEPPTPDRAKISSLVTRHHENVARGDTIANYVVMVLDARGNYVWSTYGLGAAIVEISGDSRTLTERLEFLRLHGSEYTGNINGFRGGGTGGAVRGGGGGVGVGVGAGGGFGGGAVAGRVRSSASDTLAITRRSPDSMSVVARPVGGVARAGGVGGGRFPRQDTLRAGAVITADSMTIRATGTGVRGTPTTGIAIGDMLPLDSAGTRYRLEFGFKRNFEYINVNEAPGLQQPGNGESGVQGLKSASVTLGESYQFSAGQLNRWGMRVFVLHLSPGSTWKGR